MTIARDGRGTRARISATVGGPFFPVGSLLPAFVGDAAPELQRVFTECVSVNTGWVVYHESVRDNPRIRAVADALLAFFQANGAMFSGAPRA